MRPLAGGAARGLVAGAAGTVVFDALWYRRYRAGGGESGPLRWEFSAATKWDSAGAPARLARMIYEAVLRRPLPATRIPLANNLMHWGYGTAQGGAYGLAATAVGTTSPLLGLVHGPAVFLTSYAVLGALGLYEPIWRYDSRTLWRDLGAHLVYGVATAAAFRALARGRRVT